MPTSRTQETAGASQPPLKPRRFWQRQRTAPLVDPVARGRPPVAVVTDSAAAFRSEWHRPGESLPTIVPMPVIIAGEVHQEGDPELAERLSLALAAGSPVSTSRPSPGQFERAYLGLAAAGYRNIVSLHLSAELSGTVEAARLAASRCPQLNIEVVDSRTVALGLGLGVRAAVLAAARQASVEQVLLSARSVWDSSEMFFTVPSLEQLRRSGRIGAAASWLGAMLAIKPILGLAEGKVIPLDKVRSAARAEARLEELIWGCLSRSPEAQTIAIQYFGNRGQAGHLAERLKARLPPGKEILLAELPAVLAAHAGLGLLAGTVASPPPQI